MFFLGGEKNRWSLKAGGSASATATILSLFFASTTASALRPLPSSRPTMSPGAALRVLNRCEDSWSSRTASESVPLMLSQKKRRIAGLLSKHVKLYGLDAWK